MVMMDWKRHAQTIVLSRGDGTAAVSKDHGSARLFFRGSLSHCYGPATPVAFDHLALLSGDGLRSLLRILIICPYEIY
jgi:hypothetical protein